MSDRLTGLNPAQRDAVLSIEGPLLVLAGAGAGKTKVIVERILEIIRHGVRPEEILAITFTNKAASEMRERVLKALPAGERTSPYISTFHSLGLHLIKAHAKALGYKRTPAIYDRADSMREVKRALKAIGSEDLEPRMVLGAISRTKGDGLGSAEYAQAAKYPRERAIASAWAKYETAMKGDGAVDFDDLLLLPVRLLEAHPEIRMQYQTQWHFVHIDEYQDTNKIQARLAELLIGPKKNICAVGDIDQTIYSWRGAQIANLMSFDKQYPGGKLVILEENYRSTKNILAAANDIISKNVFRKEKTLFTKNHDGENIGLYQAFDETDEAGFVVRTVKEKIANGAQPKDFAVLYRANFQSRAIEEQFLASGVAHQVLGTRFFERKEIKDMLSFVRAAVYETPADIQRALEAVPRGIGKVTQVKMFTGKEDELTGAVRDKVAMFRQLLAHINEQTQKMPPSALMKLVIVESGMEKLLKEDKLEGPERLQNLQELVSLAARYDNFAMGEGLEKFLESAALMSEQDEIKEEKNAVRLMTVHAAKGLEFQSVFIVGLEEGLFPYERENDEGSDKEEERRLMYVALTRAKRKLYLSYASYRTVFGSKNATEPSQFLSDIPDALLEWQSPERLGKTIYLD